MVERILYKGRVAGSFPARRTILRDVAQPGQSAAFGTRMSHVKSSQNINSIMNYYKIYNDLIEYRKTNIPSGYIERHHIIPKSIGGSHDPENMVKLTGREHWIAHLLLHKIHKLSQTAHACHMMAMRCEEREIPRIKNSRMYQAIRESLLPVWKSNGKKRVGKFNGSYGKIWICNISLEENKKIHKNDKIPIGWVKGRNKWKIPKTTHNRQRLEKSIQIRKIDDPYLTRRLTFVDQLPIPDGWELGGRKHTIEGKKKLKHHWEGLKRPYRVGIKHTKRIL